MGRQDRRFAIRRVPCLTLRPATERPATVTVGTNRVIGSAPERIVPEIEHILAGDVPRGDVPESWDGRAAERTVEMLSKGDQIL